MLVNSEFNKQVKLLSKNCLLEEKRAKCLFCFALFQENSVCDPLELAIVPPPPGLQLWGRCLQFRAFRADFFDS